jgi:hypothetical protein
MSKQHSEISKFLSFVLRHQPDAIGITLDREGWTDIGALIDAAANDGKHLDRDMIQAVVASSDKKRFAISDDGMRIRAVQGHSTETVDINYVARLPRNFFTMAPPRVLWSRSRKTDCYPAPGNTSIYRKTKKPRAQLARDMANRWYWSSKPCLCMNKASNFSRQKMVFGFRHTCQ